MLFRSGRTVFAAYRRDAGGRGIKGPNPAAASPARFAKIVVSCLPILPTPAPRIALRCSGAFAFSEGRPIWPPVSRSAPLVQILFTPNLNKRITRGIFPSRDNAAKQPMRTSPTLTSLGSWPSSPRGALTGNSVGIGAGREATGAEGDQCHEIHLHSKERHGNEPDRCHYPG